MTVLHIMLGDKTGLVHGRKEASEREPGAKRQKKGKGKKSENQWVSHPEEGAECLRG